VYAAGSVASTISTVVEEDAFATAVLVLLSFSACRCMWYLPSWEQLAWKIMRGECTDGTPLLHFFREGYSWSRQKRNCANHSDELHSEGVPGCWLEEMKLIKIEKDENDSVAKAHLVINESAGWSIYQTLAVLSPHLIQPVSLVSGVAFSSDDRKRGKYWKGRTAPEWSKAMHSKNTTSHKGIDWFHSSCIDLLGETCSLCTSGFQ
jgi:hypothetical protein